MADTLAAFKAIVLALLDRTVEIYKKDGKEIPVGEAVLIDMLRGMCERKVDSGDITDGYHSFDELYEHRHMLYRIVFNQNGEIAWKSKLHHDGTSFGDDWFIAGLNLPVGPITYHLPMRLWDDFDGEVLERAPEWDGHTSADVLKRLKSWWWARP